jgi:predicted ArsR family transcriptional regulator
VASDLSVLAVLGDPVRRSLYDFVTAQDREVSRAEAAAATGIQRPLAAFHLDRLAEAGLVEVTFRRTTGRSGPGAGRPAHL